MSGKQGELIIGEQGCLCPVCQQRPTNQCHHIIPQASSESVLEDEQGEGPQIWLCADCHMRLHYQVKNLMSKAKRKYYFTEPEYPRVFQLLKLLMLAIKAERLNPSLSQKKNVVIHFAAHELLVLDDLCQQLKISKTTFIKQAVQAHIMSQARSLGIV